MIKAIIMFLTIVHSSHADPINILRLLDNNSLYSEISNKGFKGKNQDLDQLITNATIYRSLTEEEMKSLSKQQLKLVELLTSYYINLLGDTLPELPERSFDFLTIPIKSCN